MGLIKAISVCSVWNLHLSIYVCEDLCVMRYNIGLHFCNIFFYECMPGGATSFFTFSLSPRRELYKLLYILTQLKRWQKA